MTKHDVDESWGPNLPSRDTPVRRLRSILESLRSPGNGCPWDLKQTHETLKPYLLEEACEVLDAIDDGDDLELCTELGDLLLQIVFHAQIASERGAFSLDDIARAIGDKLIQRHPHVFGGAKVATANEVLRNWEKIKLDTGEGRAMLDGVPRSLPALLAAYRIQEKVSSIGFDWKAPSEVVPKVREEVDEFLEAYGREDFAACEEEFGDLLFSLVNLARRAGINAEFALARTNAKFRRRFGLMEHAIEEDGQRLGTLGLEELDRYWDRVKRSE